MEKEVFHVKGFSEALERGNVPISAVVRAGHFVFVSGTPPVNPETGAIEKLNIMQQTKLSLESVKACLEAAGSSL